MADIELKIKGISKHVSLILEAFNDYDGEDFTIEAMNKPGHIFNFIFPKKGNNTNKQFAEDVLIALVKAVTKMYQLKKNTELYQSTVENIAPPEHGVPSGIVIRED